MAPLSSNLSSVPIYGRCSEDVKHALWECEAVKSVWDKEFSWVNWFEAANGSFLDLMELIIKKSSVAESLVTTWLGLFGFIETKVDWWRRQHRWVVLLKLQNVGRCNFGQSVGSLAISSCLSVVNGCRQNRGSLSYVAWVHFGIRVWVWVRDSAIFEKGGCGCGGTRRNIFIYIFNILLSILFHIIQTYTKLRVIVDYN